MTDSPTFAELRELVSLSEASIDSQFQFWLTVTFAIIVASFAARHLLSGKLRHVITFLYLLSTFVFASRWYYDYLDLVQYGEMLEALGFDVLIPFPTAISRILLMAIGTLVGIYFVYGGPKISDGK